MQTVISQRKADDLIIDSLFTHAKTFKTTKVSGAKLAHSHIGQQVELPYPSQNVVALFTKRRKDRDGIYYELYQVSEV